MAVDRSALYARLKLAYAPLLQYAGTGGAALDDAATKVLWDLAIDDSLRLLGFAPPPDPALAPRAALDLPYLADYHALRTLARRLSAQVYHHTPEATYYWQQLTEHVQALLKDAEAQIAARGYAPDIRRMAVGQITTVAPTTPPGGLDANDPRYRGSPYAPLTRRGPW